MKIEINWKKCLKTILILWWLLILFDGFYCINAKFFPMAFLPGMIRSYDKQINLIAISALYFLLFNNDVRKAVSKSVFKLFIETFYLILIFDVIITFLYYFGVESLSTLFWNNSIYLSLLSYFMFVEYTYRSGYAQRLLVCILSFSLIMGGLLLIATYMCNTMGVVILPYSEMNPLHLRNDGVRFTKPSSCMILGFTCSLGCLFSEKLRGKQYIHFIAAMTLIVTFVVTVYTIQTRALIAGFLVMFGCVGVLAGPPKKTIKRIFIGISGFGVFYFFIGDFISSIIESALHFSITELSVTARLGAYVYYLKKILENPFIGIGRLSDQTNLGRELRHGVMGIYYPDDVGLIGGIAVFGIGIAVWYFMLIRKVLKYHSSKGAFSYSLAAVLVVTVPSFFIIVEAVVPVVPLLLVLIDIEKYLFGKK